MSEKQFIKKLKAREVAIGSERDKLRELVDDAEDLIEHCDEAVECLTRAIEALSELV